MRLACLPGARDFCAGRRSRPRGRQAWALLAGGLLLLPVASLVLQALLPVQESSLLRALLILTLCGLTLPVLWLMHRSGAGYLPLQAAPTWSTADPVDRPATAASDDVDRPGTRGSSSR